MSFALYPCCKTPTECLGLPSTVITGSAALRADAAESALCAYLSVIALIGLGIDAIWHLRWADPIAALVIVPLILWEGWEAMRGKARGCC